MDEGRKRKLAVVAAIFACRKLAALEDRPSPARKAAFSESISLAEEPMRLERDAPSQGFPLRRKLLIAGNGPQVEPH